MTGGSGVPGPTGAPDGRSVPAAALRWPPGHPRILCTDAWLPNAGDAAIAVAIEEMIRSVLPDAAVVHAAYRWDSIGPRMPGHRWVPPLEALLGTPWAPPAPGCEGLGAALVAGADLVVCQGGGFLVEGYGPQARLAALAQVARTDRRMALLGMSLGTFTDGWMRADLETILRHSDLVVTRDAVSGERARAAGAADPVVGTDLTFAWSYARQPATTGDGVSVILTDHHAEAHRRPQRAAAAAAVLDEVLRRVGDDPVRVWSTVQGEPTLATEDDAAFAEQVLRAVAPHREVLRESGVMTPHRAVDLVRASRAVVSMRMHPALFATAAGVPWGVVLDDDRSAVLGEITDDAERIAPSADPDRIVAAVTAALDGPPPVESAVLAARLEAMSASFGALLGEVSVPPRSRADRARHVARRAARGLAAASRVAQGALPRPSAGAVQGPVTTGVGPAPVWGWARPPTPDDAVLAVVVRHRGRTTLASLGAPPPDVAARFGLDDDRAPVGWSTTIDFRADQATQEVTAHALTVKGHTRPLSPVTVVVDPARAGAVRFPTPHMECWPGPLRVQGAVTADQPVARIEVTVDGRPAGLARPADHDDPELAEARALAGFEHVVTIDADAQKRVVAIDVTATTVTGEHLDLGSVEVRVHGTGDGAPTVTPAPRESTVRDRGTHRDHRGDEPRRVLVVTHCLRLGGAQLWLHEVVRELAARGDRIHVVTAVDGPLRADLERWGVTVSVIPAIDHPVSPDRVDDAMLAAVDAIDPDVVLANTVLVTRFVDAAMHRRHSVVWAVHEHIPPQEIWSPADGTGEDPRGRRCAELLGDAARVLFVCDATRRLYEDAIGPSSAFVVVPYGVSVDALDRQFAAHPDARSQLRRAHGIPDDAFLLATVGTIEPRKGQAGLVLTLAALRGRHPRAHVAFVGDTGSDYARAVRRLAEQHHVADRVRFVAATREPEGWLRASDAFVMHSDSESMPRAAMEAMAAGLPVVLGDVAGCRELLDDGRAGILVPPRDLGALGAALDRLLHGSVADRASLGHAARRVVVERHGTFAYTADVCALLDEALVDPRAVSPR